MLHYYFVDKVDLITCCVQLYKSRCLTRYDNVVLGATAIEQLLDGFLEVLGTTLRKEAHLYRLWYDLRSQTLFQTAYRQDVMEINISLEAMIWRVISKLAASHGTASAFSPTLAYAIFDGLFQQCLLKHLAGQPVAIGEMEDHGRAILRQMLNA